MKGGDGNRPFGDGLKIGAPPSIKDELAAPDPVVFLPPWIHFLDHGPAIVNPSALLCNPIRPDLLVLEIGEVGNIDVEQRVLGQPILQDRLGHPNRKTGSRMELEMAAGNEGDGKGGDAEKRPFKGRGNRSGIGDVITEIPPFVNSRNDQPRTLWKNCIHREMDAVRGSAIDCIKIPFYFFNPEGTVQRERMGDGTLFPIRSYDENLSYLGESPCQKDNSLGMDSIIIGNQNLRTFTHVLRRQG